MSVVQAPAKVLVSGANGFIAIWVVKSLLEKGYAVRGTVRSLDKGDHLKKLFSSYGDSFELAVVEDISKEGAFDEAVKDVDAIEHTASPFHYNAEDPQEIIEPAVNGTVGILKSALKYGQRVRRIVITSSVAAVMASSSTSSPPMYTEADWGEESVKQVREKGKNASNAMKYWASKVLAEQAAWDFYKKNKAAINWDLTTLIPSYVYGPVLHSVNSPNELNASLKEWYDTAVKRTEPLDKVPATYIDVRDLAEFHALCLTNENAGGERFLVSSGLYLWQDCIDIVNGIERPPRPQFFDTSKANKVFGLKYRTMVETTKDILDDFKARGW